MLVNILSFPTSIEAIRKIYFPLAACYVKQNPNSQIFNNGIYNISYIINIYANYILILMYFI